MEEKNNVNVNFNLSGLLLLAFIILKLCGVIQWSWLWVLAPLWIPLGLWVVIMIVLVIKKNKAR